METPNSIEIKPDTILFHGLPLLFFTKDNQETSYLNMDDILVQKVGCGYEFTINRDSPGIVGIMIPSKGCDFIVDQRNVDIHKTNRYHYELGDFFSNIYQLDKFSINHLDRPIAHLIKQDQAYSWSCPNECIISNFQYLFEPHINIETISSGECTFYLDISSNYVINLQRYPLPRTEVLLNSHTGPSTIKKALLHGLRPRKVPNKPLSILQVTRELQAALKKQNIESVVIGSLARRLNNIPVDVGDIDIMVSTIKELKESASILGSICDQISILDKFITLKHNEISVDLSFDNYNLLPARNFIKTEHDLTFLSTEGLLWLYHMDLFSACINEYTEDFKNHVLDALHSLSTHLSRKHGEFGVISDIENVHDYSEKCSEFCSEIVDCNQEFRDIRINDPFEVRSFYKDSIIFLTVVNHGSPNDVRIIADFVPQKISWEDIAGNSKEVRIEPGNGFSVIYIENISLPGIMRCQL